MVQANALLVIPEGQFETPAGSLATAILLDDPRHQEGAAVLRLDDQGDGMASSSGAG